MNNYNVWLKNGKYDTYFIIEEGESIPDGNIIFSGTYKECKNYTKNNPLPDPYEYTVSNLV
jgi:hypothetical protein